MSADITASIMIGPIEPTSTHGRPSGLPGRRLFAPSHVLVLMENARATWIVQRCPNLRGPEAARVIQPSSPQHLLAAAILGYTALVKPEVLDGSARLRNLTTPGPRGRGLEVARIDDDLAARIYDGCAGHVYAAVTRLPESTISDAELRIAADADMQVYGVPKA